MHKNLKGALFGFFWLAVLVSFLHFVPLSTTVDAATPTSPNTFYRARIIIDRLCRSGTSEEHEVITTLAQDKVVMVIGKDSNQPEWLLVRPGTTADCWVERRFVTSDDIGFVDIVATPLDSTDTPTSTPIFTLTATSTSTATFTSTATSPVVDWTPSRTKKPPSGSNPQTQTAQAADVQTKVAQSLTQQAADAQTKVAQIQTSQALTAQACVPPYAPNLSYTVSSNGKDISLSWHGGNGATRYQVFRSKNGGGFTALGGQTSQTSATDNKQPNDTNKYYVVAINDCGSRQSNTETVTR